MGGAVSAMAAGAGEDKAGQFAGHAFISYVREDSSHVDRLQARLEAAGVQVWRDTADLWPGEDWRVKIRRAIEDGAFVFIACFSHHSLARERSYQNEELTLAIEQLRMRHADQPWLMPVRFSDCDIPDRDIGAGRALRYLQRADLFGEHAEDGMTRLVAAVQRLLEHAVAVSRPATSGPAGRAHRPAGGVDSTSYRAGRGIRATPTTACPFCFIRIDSSRLAYQCAGRGHVACRKEEDSRRIELTGSTLETYPTFMAPEVRIGQSATCPFCGGPARRRACPECHTALPVAFLDSKSSLVGLVGSKGSGKTVLMTVVVKQLREVIGTEDRADIRIYAEGLSGYLATREFPLYKEGVLPCGTSQLRGPGRQHPTPVVLCLRHQAPRSFGSAVRSTVLSFVDAAGEDLNDQNTAFTLPHLSVCDGLIVTLDPFALPGARAQISLPYAAIQVDDDMPLDVVIRITELLRTERNVRPKKKVPLPVAFVFTKIDAFYPTLDAQNPIMASPSAAPVYDNADGWAVHEHVRALLHEWHADNLDTHIRLNYADYRYFAVSALGAQPDYEKGTVAPGGMRPHRVADPVLWLLTREGRMPEA